MDIDVPDESPDGREEKRSHAAIQQLAASDEKVSKLLRLAGETFNLLHPEHSKEWQTQGQDLSSDTSPNTSNAKAKISEFYALLNEIQTDLRDSIRNLREQKATPLPLLSDTMPSSDTLSGPSLGATRMQAAAWAEIRQAVEDLKSRNILELGGNS